MHRLDRPERAQLLERSQTDEVAGMQDEVGLAEPPHTLVRQAPRTPREMRVGDDGYARAVSLRGTASARTYDSPSASSGLALESSDHGVEQAAGTEPDRIVGRQSCLRLR